jgi:saccharopine dehydrogenase-like NADP-dependent oxidoreductase
MVIGGYGVFGSRLMQLLIKTTSAEVIVSGRDQMKLDAFCSEFGVTPCQLDRDKDDELDRVLNQLRPTLIIDAAGPFQTYGTDPYRVARKAITKGIHYLDLADDRGFVLGISTLDSLAKDNQVTALAGASSIPALSAAAIDALCGNLRECALIETTIVPANRAPRGLSVVRAILSQVGKPFRLWRGGRFNEFTCWEESKFVTLSIPGVKPLSRRPVSLFDAPDHDLFPQRYGAKSVLFYAGLELKSMHFAVWSLGWLVRLGIMSSLAPFATTARWLAERLTPFGSDRGGMRVSVSGRNEKNVSVRRSWTLIAEAGDGPNIPTIPAAVLTQKILSGQIAPGARPCVGEFTLSEAETTMQCFATKTHVEEQATPTLFERALGHEFSQLPSAVQNLHTVFDQQIYEGTANIERGRGFMSRLYAFMAGFPPAATQIRTQVQISIIKNGERWIRQFGHRRFQSYLYRRATDEANIIWEKFGVFSFAIRLHASQKGLRYPVERARVGMVPLPRFLLPISESSEWEDETGSFRFDVSISLPTGGLIARYVGSLRCADNL